MLLNLLFRGWWGGILLCHLLCHQLRIDPRFSRTFKKRHHSLLYKLFLFKKKLVLYFLGYFIIGIWQLKTKLLIISTSLFLCSMDKSVKLCLFQIHLLCIYLLLTTRTHVLTKTYTSLCSKKVFPRIKHDTVSKSAKNTTSFELSRLR